MKILFTIAVLVASVVQVDAEFITIDMVTVGNPGNAPDTRYDPSGELPSLAPYQARRDVQSR